MRRWQTKSLSRRLARFLGAEIIRKSAKAFDEVIDLCAPIWLLMKGIKRLIKLQEKRNGVFWTPLIFWRGKVFKPFSPDRVLNEPSARRYLCLVVFIILIKSKVNTHYRRSGFFTSPYLPPKNRAVFFRQPRDKYRVCFFWDAERAHKIRSGRPLRAEAG